VRIPLPGWDGPGRLFSLWDLMQRVLLSEGVSVGSVLEVQAELCRSMGGASIPAKGERIVLPSGQVINRDVLAANIRSVELACATWSLNQSRLLAFDLQTLVEHDPRPHTFLEIAGRIDSLRAAIMNEAMTRILYAVPSNLSRYVAQDRPVGDAVYDAFPSARHDLAEAGNCLAYGCNTAAAFHLMRAAEIGLWELARDRRTPLAKAQKVEFSEWGKIIGELEDEVRAVQQWPNRSTKEDAHKFYNAALVEIRAFNDGWRRHAAHPRPHQPPMQDDEALALWGHVARFLATLATKISEGAYTPLVW
jgi:hypothetical protein